MIYLLLRTTRSWLPIAVLTTGLCGLVYVVAQQNYRQSANDPQIQMSEDAARAFSRGATVGEVLPSSKQIEISESLAPYIVVYDESGKPIASSGLLHGAMPMLPPGVFDYARKYGQDRVTWQPESGVRSATVLTHFGGASSGFVLAGRSLTEIEKRESKLTLVASLMWLGLLAFTFLYYFIFSIKVFARR